MRFLFAIYGAVTVLVWVIFAEVTVEAFVKPDLAAGIAGAIVTVVIAVGSESIARRLFHSTLAAWLKGFLVLPLQLLRTNRETIVAGAAVGSLMVLVPDYLAPWAREDLARWARDREPGFWFEGLGLLLGFIGGVFLSVESLVGKPRLLEWERVHLAGGSFGAIFRSGAARTFSITTGLIFAIGALIYLNSELATVRDSYDTNVLYLAELAGLWVMFGLMCLGLLIGPGGSAAVLIRQYALHSSADSTIALYGWPLVAIAFVCQLAALALRA